MSAPTGRHFYRRAWVIDVRYLADMSQKSAMLDGR
jgi:hypothetical protein